MIAVLVFFGGIALTKLAILMRFRIRASYGTVELLSIAGEGLTLSGNNGQKKR
jgi:hypothetical protein